MINPLVVALVASLLLIITSCASIKKVEPSNAEEAFNEGVRLFEKADYLEAQTYFDLIKLQYPASNFADAAQYYTAEISFKKKEYVLSSFHYGRVRTVYPGSKYAKDALYKSAYSQYLLSPTFDKDQDYTKKAIKTFQEYQFYYNNKEDSLYKAASNMIQELRDKLGEKDFRIAELYRIMDSPRAAIIYYDTVINEYADSSFFEPALFGKIESLLLMQKTDEANMTIATYNKLFPNGKYSSQITNLVNANNSITNTDIK